MSPNITRSPEQIAAQNEKYIIKTVVLITACKIAQEAMNIIEKNPGKKVMVVWKSHTGIPTFLEAFQEVCMNNAWHPTEALYTQLYKKYAENDQLCLNVLKFYNNMIHDVCTDITNGIPIDTKRFLEMDIVYHSHMLQ